MSADLKLLVGIFTLAMVCSGCVSQDGDVSVNTSVEEDKAYFDRYEKATRNIEVIDDNFETKYMLSTTALSPGFMQALAERHQKIYADTQPIFAETGAKAAFFVTVYTSNNELSDLSDADLWSVQLESMSKVHKPALIRKLRKKDRWSPFFSHVNPWSKEFLVLFDADPPNLFGPERINKNSIKVTFANANAKVSVTW